LEPKRYVWHADGQEVLNKIHRAWEVATNPPNYLSYLRDGTLVMCVELSSHRLPTHMQNLDTIANKKAKTRI
jgi:hypothetical protein